MAERPPGKVIVVMPARNAARTLEQTYAAIPREWVDEIILVDDKSTDDTIELARGLPLHVIWHPHNVGYGGNQKTCYLEALQRDADVGGDAAPRRPVRAEPDPDAWSSRSCAARPTWCWARGWPSRARPAPAGCRCYKYVANRGLTAIENRDPRHPPVRAAHRLPRLFAPPAPRGARSCATRSTSRFDSELLMQAATSASGSPRSRPATRYFDDASSIALAAGDRVRGQDAVGGAAPRAAPRGHRCAREVHAVTSHRRARSRRRPAGSTRPGSGTLPPTRSARRFLGPGRALDLGCGIGHSLRRAGAAARRSAWTSTPSALAGQDRETHRGRHARAARSRTRASRRCWPSTRSSTCPTPSGCSTRWSRVLEPGGAAVFVTPNRLTFARPDEIIDPYHYVEYDPGELRGPVRPAFRPTCRVHGLFGSDRYLELVDEQQRRARPPAGPGPAAPAETGAPRAAPAAVRPHADPRARATTDPAPPRSGLRTSSCAPRGSETASTWSRRAGWPDGQAAEQRHQRQDHPGPDGEHGRDVEDVGLPALVGDPRVGAGRGHRRVPGRRSSTSRGLRATTTYPAARAHASSARGRVPGRTAWPTTSRS